MIDVEAITIPLNMPPAEAMALAQFASRLNPQVCARFAALCTVYGERPEADVIWSGIGALRSAFIRAGFPSRRPTIALPATVGGGARLNVDTLTAAWLQFEALADAAFDADVRDAMRLAMRISDSLSELRSRAQEIVVRAAGDGYIILDAVRDLRRAIDETARMGG